MKLSVICCQCRYCMSSNVIRCHRMSSDDIGLHVFSCSFLTGFDLIMIGSYLLPFVVLCSDRFSLILLNFYCPSLVIICGNPIMSIYIYPKTTWSLPFSLFGAAHCTCWAGNLLGAATGAGGEARWGGSWQHWSIASVRPRLDTPSVSPSSIFVL